MKNKSILDKIKPTNKGDINKFLIISQTNPLLTIDYALLAKQKIGIVDGDSESIDGILNLLDAIQDYAADVLEIPGVFDHVKDDEINLLIKKHMKQYSLFVIDLSDFDDDEKNIKDYSYDEIVEFATKHEATTYSDNNILNILKFLIGDFNNDYLSDQFYFVLCDNISKSIVKV